MLLWSECLCSPPPNSYVEILNPNMVALRGGAFGRRLGRDGAALMDEVSALTKEMALGFSYM